jgi:hypothetical protein
MSKDGDDFHSEEDTGGESGASVTLQHSFRTQLATDILRAVDATSSVQGPLQSAPQLRMVTEGSMLSSQKAKVLLQRDDLLPLYNLVNVKAAAEVEVSTKRKKEQVGHSIAGYALPAHASACSHYSFSARGTFQRSNGSGADLINDENRVSILRFNAVTLWR